MATTKTTDANGTTVCFEGKGQLEDYGVPGSPTWLEIDDITITSIELEDGTFFEGDDITPELHDKYIGLADGLEWDTEDENDDDGYDDYLDSKRDRD